MNAAATAFARPPERRRCGRTISATLRSARARNSSGRPPKRFPANPNHHLSSTRIWIDFTVASSFTSPSRRDPDRSPKGGIA